MLDRVKFRTSLRLSKGPIGGFCKDTVFLRHFWVSLEIGRATRMITNNEGLVGSGEIAGRLRIWNKLDSPDIINATVQYVAHEWSANRAASPNAVHSVYAMLRNLGAAGDAEAAVIACALERLLEQHGFLRLSFDGGSNPLRRCGEKNFQARH